MKTPPHKQGVFVEGRTFAQLEDDAKKSIRAGVGMSAKIVLRLLAKYSELYDETASLRQTELFAPASVRGRTGDR